MQHITLECSNNLTKREQFVLISKLNSTNKAVPINFQINPLRRLLKDLSLKVNISHEKQISQEPIYHGNTLGNSHVKCVRVLNFDLTVLLTRASISYLTYPILKLTTSSMNFNIVKALLKSSPLLNGLRKGKKVLHGCVLHFQRENVL